MKDLKDRAKALHVTVQIGKAGLTSAMVEEINKQLDHNELVKVKLLKSYLFEKGKAEAINEILQATEAQLIYRAGFVVAIFRKSRLQKAAKVKPKARPESRTHERKSGSSGKGSKGSKKGGFRANKKKY